MVQIILGDEATSETGKVSLSHNTVAHRISKLSSDIQELTLEKIGSSQFVLQADEVSAGKVPPANIRSVCRWIQYYRSVFIYEGDEKTSTTDVDIFHIVDTVKSA